MSILLKETDTKSHSFILFISSYPPFVLLSSISFALSTGISVYIKEDKTSVDSVPLCEIYPSKAKKYIDKIFKEKVRK
jgi:hypothetical protein